MQIAGKATNPVNMEELVSSVTALPSGFTNRTVKRTSTAPYERTNAFKLNEKGSEAFIAGMKEGSINKIQLAYKYHSQAVQAASRHKNPLIKAIALSRYASVLPYIEQEGVNNAIKALTDATVTARDIGAKDFASQFSDSLHAQVYRIAKQAMEESNDAQAIEGWTNALQTTRIQTTKLFRNERGQPENDNAFRVEQGEIGFSNSEHMGTDAIAQCISPILHNPETKQTALAHIDQSTDAKTLEQALDKIGYSSTGLPIEVRLIGGNDKISSHKQLQGLFSAMARGNVLSTLEFLKGKNVNIISADILSEDQPQTVVVDPKTFTLTEAIPSYPNPDFFLANGFAMMSVEEERGLRTAFDLSRSKERSPVLVEGHLATKLSYIAQQSLLDTYALFYQDGTEMERAVSERVESTLAITQAHESAVSDIMHAIQHHGLNLNNEGMQTIWSVATQRPVHVGSNANIANQPLFDFIQDGLLRKRGLFRRGIALDIDGLANTPVAPSPLDLIHS